MQTVFSAPYGTTAITLPDGSVVKVSGGTFTAPSDFIAVLETAGCRVINLPQHAAEHAAMPQKRPGTISAMVPLMPSFDASALTATQRTLFTAPGDFDAVALITINIGLATTLDGACIAVTERTDTS